MNDVTKIAPDPFAPLSVAETHAETQDVAEWLPELPAPEEPPEMVRHRRFGASSAHWVYRDAQDRPLFAVYRFDPRGAKQVLPRTFGTLKGRRGWHWKAPPAPRPLYRLDRLALRPAAPVLVCEGEKATEAAALLFPDMVAVASQGGGSAADKADWTPLSGRAVAIWPDNDAAGAAYAQAVAEWARSAGVASVRVVTVPQHWPDGWDLADALPEGVTPETLARMVAEAKPAQALPNAATELPRGFRFLQHGLHFLPEPTERNPDPASIFIAAPFEVVGETNDGDGNNWGLLICWQDRDGRPHQWAIPRRLVHGDGNAIAAELDDAGLACGPSQRAHELLKRFLGEVRASRRLRAVPRTGWHHADAGPVFLLPGGEAFGPAADAVILQAERVGGGKAFRQAGMLAEWQHQIARYAVGNDLLALFLSAAFAAPLLDVVSEPSGGLHLFGRSQSGKTTALRMAGSVWGPGDASGQVRTWRATANGLEGTAAETCDAVLILDELGQADPREVGETVYLIANEAGKARAARDGTARPRLTWRVALLSTGEVTLAVKLGEAGKRLMAGQEVRLISLPADAGKGLGVFQILHGMTGAAALAEHLREASRTQYGTAARAFLARLANDRAREPEALRRTVEDWREGFLAAHVPAGADGQVRSVARRLALIGAAGELARDYGVLPWPEGEALRAAGAGFKAWLALRGGAGAAEDTQAVAQVRAFIEAHGESRFTLIGAPPEARTVNRAGFRRRVETHAGEGWEYLILPEAWRGEVCKGLDAGRAAAVLAARSLLARADNGHLTMKVRLPDHGRSRVYVVRGAILGGDDAE